MDASGLASHWIASEASALERRLADLPLFSETIPMVSEAAPSDVAMAAADRSIRRSRAGLSAKVRDFRGELSGKTAAPGAVLGRHRRLIALRDQYDALLSAYDIYADAVTQRAEHGVGTVLRGLDALARDALRVRPGLFEPPPLVCYFDTGIGGAIRRVFTRLPNGEANGVALIKLPRERLFSSALASLLHEAGHQGVALLDLVPSYAAALGEAVRKGQVDPHVGRYWSAKLSEVLPDAWALGKLGVTATQGLFLAMGRSKRFTFHERPQDPHPMPYLRGLLSAWVGEAALPDPAWARLRVIWDTLYEDGRFPGAAGDLVRAMKPSLGRIGALLAGHRPAGLKGRTLPEVLGAEGVHPARLAPTLDSALEGVRRGAAGARPCRLLAQVGLARFLGKIDAAEEHDVLKQAIKGFGRLRAD